MLSIFLGLGYDTLGSWQSGCGAKTKEGYVFSKLATIRPCMTDGLAHVTMHYHMFQAEGKPPSANTISTRCAEYTSHNFSNPY